MDTSKIGMLCKSPRATREAQEAALREAGAERIIEFKRVIPKSWRDVVNILCDGDTLFIYALSLVPTKRGEDELVPSAQVSEFLIEVHEAGAQVVEVYSGRNSKDRAQRRAMTKDAVKALKNGSRSLPSIGRERGRPKTEWSMDVLEKAKVVWFSHDYRTNVIAARHLPKGFTSKHAWTLFGASGRPYKDERKWSKEARARNARKRR